jgi:hypothetical protein
MKSYPVEVTKAETVIPVFQTKWVERLDEFKHLILDHKKSNHTFPDKNVYANWRSAWNLHEIDSRFKPIAKYFEDLATSISTQFWSGTEIFKTVNLWAMTYGPNEGAKNHSHSPYPSSMAFIFYIDVNENSAPICVGNKCRPVENGLVLGFPANVDHWVPDDYEGERIVISANLDRIPPQLLKGEWKLV